jgi:hypothetical protein
LATGEEEYQPDADMTVYNPIGPSVVWQRVYNSLRDAQVASGDYSYENQDYGYGWHQVCAAR